ncbi:hypothetical protein NE237_010130 [Protea cynaroides]|uniref:Uncharacterized protein n=1 Tax=Protea cynaroides TaxID=273540 RepID=A0A9Q0R1D6_9MAGN|nr:hypothetical protein NE237_010130 [Protea cynaroides]
MGGWRPFVPIDVLGEKRNKILNWQHKFIFVGDKDKRPMPLVNIWGFPKRGKGPYFGFSPLKFPAEATPPLPVVETNFGIEAKIGQDPSRIPIADPSTLSKSGKGKRASEE